MKKILLIALFILMLSNLAFSLSKFSEIEKIMKIKIFESTQKDVQKVLPEYIDDDFKASSTMFRTEIGYLIIAFSGGDCGEDEYSNVKRITYRCVNYQYRRGESQQFAV